jgi:NarL family two-component system sensor histidine kinase YdfH
MPARKLKSAVFPSFFAGPSLYWYLLLWMGLVYIGGVFGETTFLHGIRPCAQGVCAAVVAASNTLSFPVLVAFTLLMGLLCMLLWLSMDGRWRLWQSWGSFLFQGVIVLIISLLPEQQQLYVTFSLYLALTLAALAVFQRARPVVLIGGCYGLFFVADLATNLFENVGGVKLLDQASRGSPLLVTALGTVANYLALLLFAAGYLVMYVQQLHAHAQLEQAHQDLQASAAQVQELTLLNERQRMARELHDTLVQDLAGLIRQLDVAHALLSQQRIERAQAILQESSSSARSALVEARCAIGNLRAGTTEAVDLSHQVREEIERLARATGIHYEMALNALAHTPASLHEPVLKTIREGLTNVVRYAQASRVWIEAAIHQNTLTVTIGDDGIGFSPARARQAGHYGLVGLQERAQLAQGHLEIRSAPGKGTILVLQLPLQEEGALK